MIQVFSHIPKWQEIKISSMYVSIIPFPNICGLTNKLTRKIMSETEEWWRMGVTKQGNIKKNNNNNK